MDAGGVERVGQGHRRQEGGQPPRQLRCACPGETREAHMMGRTPAVASASPQPSGMPTDTPDNPLFTRAPLGG
jgi:hypothetical protein